MKSYLVKKAFLCYALFICCIAFSISPSVASDSIKIGWASVDITPAKPVLLRGQFHARLSEGILDPIGATALAVESVGDRPGTRVILVSCDLVVIPDYLRDRVRELVSLRLPELDPADIVISATHTHTAPMMAAADSDKFYGLPFEWLTNGQDAMTPKGYVDFAIEPIADAIMTAWQNRKSGGISWGLSKAVIGHNRLLVDKTGRSRMYGNTNSPEFSHVEGYEDHNLNLLYTWGTAGELTGVVINAAVPSQVVGGLYQISADFWTEAKAMLREELKEDLFVLPQVSAAGDQTPFTTWDDRGESRMQKLMGFESLGTGRNSIGRMKQIARYITDGVKAVLPYMEENIEWNPVLAQRTETILLSRRSLDEVDEEFIRSLDREVVERKHVFDSLYSEVEANPGIRAGNRWYRDISAAFSHYNRALAVQRRYRNPTAEKERMSIEAKVMRIGDMAFATNPFELYLDYGIQIKSRSPAVQTFVVQLAGGGTYVPTQRAVDGGGYGSAPASTPVGPKGGEELVEKTIEMLHLLWKK